MTAAILLTGGASTRLGSDKAAAVVGGTTLAVRAAELLTLVANPIVEVGPGFTTLPTTRETPAGGGPLAAVAAGMAWLSAAGGPGEVLVLATDLPHVTPALLSLIADWADRDRAVVPIAGGVRQPLCARYPMTAEAVAGRLLAHGSRSMMALLDELDVVEIDESQWRAVAPHDSFLDVDEPADLERARAREE